MRDDKTKKSTILSEIGREMVEIYLFDLGKDAGSKCYTKWQNVYGSYKKDEAKFSVTGSGLTVTLKKSPFYDEVEAILGIKGIQLYFMGFKFCISSL